LVPLAFWYTLLFGSSCFLVHIAFWYTLLFGSSCFLVPLAFWFLLLFGTHGFLVHIACWAHFYYSVLSLKHSYALKPSYGLQAVAVEHKHVNTRTHQYVYINGPHNGPMMGPKASTCLASLASMLYLLLCWATYFYLSCFYVGPSMDHDGPMMGPRWAQMTMQ
jgi:hypothetical protein